MIRRKSDNNSNNKLLYDPNQRQNRRLGAFSYGQNYEGEQIDEETTEEVVEEQEEIVEQQYYSTTITQGVNDTAKEVAKDTIKKGILEFIKKNPWVIAIVIGLVILLLVFLVILGGGISEDGGFNTACDFNLTTVALSSCSENERDITTDEMTLKDYVINTTYKIAGGRGLTDEAIKAIMIIVKTNALSNGYDNENKNVSVSECSVNSFYTKTDNISNNVSVGKTENEAFWWPVGSVETEVINGITYASGEPSSTRITSHYGARNTGIKGASTNHKGLDIGNGGNGAGYHNVIASLSGKVITVDTSCYTPRGCYIKIDHGTYQTLYQHLHKGSIVVKTGDTVSQGQVLAKMGASGVGSGAHLHFEVFYNGSNVDPEDYVNASNPRMVITTESSTSDIVKVTTEASISDLYDELYDKIENELYLDINYTGTITSLSSDNSLNLDADNLNTIGLLGRLEYNEILDIVYASNDAEEESVEYGIYDLNGNCEYISGSGLSNFNSMYNTASTNLVTFINAWEGNEGYCDDGRGYLAADLKDGTITIGYGVTNYGLGNANVKNYIDSNNWGDYFRFSDSRYYVNARDCVPVEVIDKIKLFALEANYSSTISSIAAKYDIELTQYQKDAITSFNYNLGSGYTENLIKAYAEGSYNGLWNEMKKYMHATLDGVYQEVTGLKKRRKGEFALFVTGDYSDLGLFYSRGLDDYDNYDSEGVISRIPLAYDDETEEV